MVYMCQSQLRSYHLVIVSSDFSQVISSVSVIAWSLTVLTIDAAIALLSLSNPLILIQISEVLQDSQSHDGT